MAQEVIAEGKKHGWRLVSIERTMRRALKKLGGKSEKASFGTGWVWADAGAGVMTKGTFPYRKKLSASSASCPLGRGLSREEDEEDEEAENLGFTRTRARASRRDGKREEWRTSTRSLRHAHEGNLMPTKP